MEKNFLKSAIARLLLAHFGLALLWFFYFSGGIKILFPDLSSAWGIWTLQLILFFIVMGAIFYFLFWPHLRQLMEKINELEKSRQELVESREYLRAILDSNNDVIFVEDAATGKVLDVNERVQDVYGHTREAVFNMPIIQLSCGETPYSEKEISEWLAKTRTEGMQTFEWLARHSDGHCFWVEISMRLALVGGQERFVVSAHPIGERKRAENDLKENQRILSTLMSNLPGMVYRCQNDPDWTMEYVSEGALSLTGYLPADFFENARIPFASIIHPDDRQMVWDTIQQHLQSNSPYALIYRIIDASGQEKWVWEQGRGIFSETNQLLFLEGFIMDVSEQKRAQDQLLEINTRLNVLINATPDVIVFKDAQNRWLEANNSQLQLFQLEGVNYYGKTDKELSELTDPLYQDAFLSCEQSDEAAWAQGSIYRVEESIPLPAGGVRVYDVIKSPIFNSSGERKGLVVFGRDITEKQKAEDELRTARETYEGILRSVTEAVHIQDESGVFLDVNAAAETMTGYPREELLGNTPEFLTMPGRNNFDEIRAFIVRAYHGQPHRFEFHGRKKNGSAYLGEISLTPGWYFGQKVVIAIGRDISSRKHAEQMLYNRLSELEAISAIDRAISSSFDLQITFDVLLKQALHKLNVDAAAILLFDPDLQSMHYTAGQGFQNPNFRMVQVRPGQGLSGKVMLERRRIATEAAQEIYRDPVLARLCQNDGFESYIGVPLISKGQVKGVLEVFHRSSLPEDPDWLNFLETLANQAAIAIDNFVMFDNLQHKNLELAIAYDSTIEGWAHALELREGESLGHTSRITDQTLELARALGLSASDQVALRRGVLLHDVGKMGIPDEILLKKGRLSAEERKIIEQHPLIAYNMLAKIDFLKQAILIPRYHHEKWDGSGYPEGLRGTQIPYHARIFSVIDVWDALTHDRPYRLAWQQEDALEYMREQSGKHFDPEILKVFLQLLKKSSP